MLFRDRRIVLDYLLLCAVTGGVTLAGCQGAAPSLRTAAPVAPGAQSAMTPAAQTLTKQAAQANVEFSIKITPLSPNQARKPAYLAPTTQSLTILTDGATPVSFDIVTSSPSCSPVSGAPGTFKCTVSFHATPGNRVFTISAYGQTGGRGGVLSSSTTGTIDVKPTGTTTISLTLDGVVQSATLSLANAHPPVGVPATIGLAVVLQDSDYNIIVGPDPYRFPVTLKTSDAANGALTKPVLRSPVDAASAAVKYSGAMVPGITFSATAVVLHPDHVLPATLAPGVAYAPLRRFTGGADSAGPQGGLLNINGTLYGSTLETTGYGTIFALSPSGTKSTVYAFKGGAHPNGNLLEVNGDLYGTTFAGGTAGLGTIFRVSLAGAKITLYSFKGGTDGINPSRGLLEVGGTLYGETDSGGATATEPGSGIVFKISPAGAYAVVARFPRDGNASPGVPRGSLFDVNGTLYGTAVIGGPYYCGALFALTLGGTLTFPHQFGNGTDGCNPNALIDVDGEFYGTTNRGGRFSSGTIYRISPAGSEKVLYSFGTSPRDGGPPRGALHDVNGTLYGTTSGNGTLFELSIATGTFLTIFDFPGGANGYDPTGDLTNIGTVLFGSAGGGVPVSGEIDDSGGIVYALTP
jgi:uncharacterized repeat protein (TIGR03803 family)